MDSNNLVSGETKIFNFHIMNEFIAFFLGNRQIQPELIYQGVFDSAKRIGFETEHPHNSDEYGINVEFIGANSLQVKLDKRTKLEKEKKYALMVSKEKYGEDETNIYMDQTSQFDVTSTSKAYIRLLSNSNTSKSENYGIRGWIIPEFKTKIDSQNFGKQLITTMRRIFDIFSDRSVWNLQLDTAIVDLINRSQRKLTVPWSELGMRDVIEEAMDLFQDTQTAAPKKQKQDQSSVRNKQMAEIRSDSPSSKDQTLFVPPSLQVRDSTKIGGRKAGQLPSPSYLFTFNKIPTINITINIPSPLNVIDTEITSKFSHSQITSVKFSRFQPQVTNPILIILQMASTLPSQTPFAHIPLDVCIQIAKPMLNEEDEKKAEMQIETTQQKKPESIEVIKDPL
ncbi:MAG: hypothetical protein EZS28_047627, partial [Streblomastix strix]